MKTSGFTTAIMTGMYMWTYSMCIAFCALVSDMLSILEVNTHAA